ncbi:hypothetical protein SPRG_03631 [Saprolegnia parasitica CBS 223.65]|uniref:HIT-type domain-containing protein n=1 Tax=Saprolegnia parasitica (strain CBS 223.65) TaxID=695850 RepID=A0A067CML1_SAPPC|nr:hypothetical protein SPRG_03631 [Saprolegnia parasitica CBS 223.65]KDO31713.1 hypothetical protein SPRG_03631 [Saprolegnia parasitica CBS 223.65]|eukprot:XP_012197596.1 hypothetical protein SPRG_03631 [Saprolegnia parasitica CBS 223.65]
MDRRAQPPPTPITVPIRFGSTKTTLGPSAAIQLHESTSSAGISNSSALRVCGVCTEAASKYTCPRCNVVYCGVACYKTHGETCTEHFYKAHVESEMQLNKTVDTTSAHAMQEALRRVYDEFADENPSLDDRLEQLVELMESDALTLDALTPDERAQFLREVADGRLGKLIALWTPWWTSSPAAYAAATKSARHQLIVAIDDEDDEDDEDDGLPQHPKQLLTTARAKALEPISALHAAPNGPVLRCNLFELLFAYAYTLRDYNGDWTTDVLEASATLIALSPVLHSQRVYLTIEDVRAACATASLPDMNAAAAAAALEDAATLSSASLFVCDALCDLEALLLRAVDMADKRARKRLRAMAKTVHFYLVWSNSNRDGAAEDIL